MRTNLLLTFTLCTAIAQAQPQYSPDIQKEHLGRGVVCIANGDSAIISWRLLSQDSDATAFNIYANGKRLNTTPLTQSTFFTAPRANTDVTYTVRTIDSGKESGRTDGTFTLSANAKDYISIPLDIPAEGVTPDGRTYRYSANDASVGDVDGDGEYEVILKWDPSNSHDNSHEGFTGNVILDCYKIPRTSFSDTNTSTHRMWRINLGRNIRAGAHYTPFLVYDFDGDGKSELVIKTADGTIDGQGNIIGDSTRNWVMDKMVSKQISGKAPQKQVRVSGRILEGPEYLTIFEGSTGRALKTVDYQPPRGDVGSWGDTYGNRCDRYLAAVAYLDGQHPSAVMCRGYYTKSFLAAYDWDGTNLTLRWLFDSQTERGYSGQGNHNLRVGDVDGDGCDEITYGSMAVDHNGKGLYTTRMGHGDAIHQYAFYPDSTSLQIWDVHENKRDGSDFRDAKTGRIIFQIPSGDDVGRGMAADIDPTNYGLEMWSASQRGYYDVNGTQHHPDAWIPMNSAVWWDGDMLRELLDRNAVLKWNWTNATIDNLKDFRQDGCTFNNGTKQNPCLSADILGDWREEVLVRTSDSRELRIYTTPHTTTHRMPSLMLDIPYRLSVAAENVGYNQPPEPGAYIGEKTRP